MKTHDCKSKEQKTMDILYGLLHKYDLTQDEKDALSIAITAIGKYCKEKLGEELE